MASNSFGNIFKITTWGESHGKAVGVVIDGCPAGLEIDASEINAALALRAPGRTPHTSPRKETDQAEILSGVFKGKTTGAPICLMILNQDVDSSKYEPIKDLLRPGHANYTYLEKYGVFDYRGGGRSSARETACRVAAGAVAKKFLEHNGIQLLAYIKQIGNIEAIIDVVNFEHIRTLTHQSPVFCPDREAASAMTALIEKVKIEGDSLGGMVEFVILSIPPGLGDPIYGKLEANLAHAMMSLPATKGFEIGSGFRSVAMQGSEHNDIFTKNAGKVQMQTNHSGGTLGGISTGMPLIGRVAFKPTSSIMHAQETLTITGEPASFKHPEGSRHDPCVAIRAVPVVEAMAALVIVDAILLNRCVKL
ncbi:MAG: chorismate synthase [Parachlamydiaceae bacterium]